MIRLSTTERSALRHTGFFEREEMLERILTRFFRGRTMRWIVTSLGWMGVEMAEFVRENRHILKDVGLAMEIELAGVFIEPHPKVDPLRTKADGRFLGLLAELPLIDALPVDQRAAGRFENCSRVDELYDTLPAWCEKHHVPYGFCAPMSTEGRALLATDGSNNGCGHRPFHGFLSGPYFQIHGPAIRRMAGEISSPDPEETVTITVDGEPQEVPKTVVEQLGFGLGTHLALPDGGPEGLAGLAGKEMVQEILRRKLKRARWALMEMGPGVDKHLVNFGEDFPLFSVEDPYPRGAWEKWSRSKRAELVWRIFQQATGVEDEEARTARLAAQGKAPPRPLKLLLKQHFANFVLSRMLQLAEMLSHNARLFGRMPKRRCG